VPHGLASLLEARQTYRRRRWRADTPPAVPDKMSQGTANMEDHEMRRKIIREWMALPKDSRLQHSPKRRPRKTSSTAVGAIRHGNFGAIRTKN